MAAAAAFFALIREQGAVADEQFLKSMIPHHAGAILMCEEAGIEDPGVLDLCGRIVENQQAEIAEMKAKLAELDGRSPDARSTSKLPSRSRSAAGSRAP